MKKILPKLLILLYLIILSFFSFYFSVQPPPRAARSLHLIHLLLFSLSQTLVAFRFIYRSGFPMPLHIYVYIPHFDRHFLREGLSMKLQKLLWVLNILNYLPPFFLSLSAFHLYLSITSTFNLIFQSLHSLFIRLCFLVRSIFIPPWTHLIFSSFNISQSMPCNFLHCLPVGHISLFAFPPFKTLYLSHATSRSFFVLF